MRTENIVKTAERIRQLQQRVDERRSAWSQSTKAKICERLEQICNETHIGLSVTGNDLCKNFASVQLIFGIVPSGIVEYLATGGAHGFTKNGGYLNFAQTMSGKVMVSVYYPFVEHFDDKPTPLEIGYHEPEEFSENVIIAYVERFLEEIAKWEENWSPPDTSIDTYMAGLRKGLD